MSTDDERFPPVNGPSRQPLDLSVLARAASTSTITEEPPRRRDTPPTQRQTPRDEEPAPRATRARKTPLKSAPTSSQSADDDAIKDYRPGILVKPLRDLYVTVGTLVLPFNNPVGTAFIQNAEQCAKALDNAAKADKQIRRVLMLLVQGSVWGEVIIAHMPIMMALAVTMMPSVRNATNAVQSEAGNGETFNPVSNGFGGQQ